ncbi:MAG: DUF87 domain-containing protein [Salinarimonas sp.]|nr:DUF87 domain-containing protein [Salinarimonas sp.]
MQNHDHFVETLSAESPEMEAFGTLVDLAGAHAEVWLTLRDSVTVGDFVCIATPLSQTIAVITKITEAGAETGAHARIDMLGEVLHLPDGRSVFQRGVSIYPRLGARVLPMHRETMRDIHTRRERRAIALGTLALDPQVTAYIDIDEMLTKHFAVLGTTGVGKSSGIALMLRAVLSERPRQRIFLLDPHAEYANCFEPDQMRLITPENLRLPFWMFAFEEFVDALFRARPGVDAEVNLLAQAIMTAKADYARERSGPGVSLRRPGSGGEGGFTVDTPAPYRLVDLLRVLDEGMGRLDNRSEVPVYQRLIARIRSLSQDPRYAFMFADANIGGDTMLETLDGLFNLTDPNRRMTVMQLAGLPAEVVDSVVSVLARLAFELGLWSAGAVPLLFVCEEAHRYAPADRHLGFGPTKKAISRIAKEGRKYGIGLGLVTQRPADLDPPIISQCSTLFAMRMANDRDQAIVKSAVSDAAESLVAFVPALGIREVFAFGEAVPLPMRIRFDTLPARFLPGPAQDMKPRDNAVLSPTDIAAVIARWRRAGSMRETTESLSGDRDEDFQNQNNVPIMAPDRRNGASQPGAVRQEQAMPARSRVETLRDDDMMPQEFSALQSTLLRRRLF